MIITLMTSAGCSSIWQKVRERDRLYSVDNARTFFRRGTCGKALDSLDRAQTRLDLGAYGRESTLTRARCYEKLGLSEIARAHDRLIRDFYEGPNPAYPAADGSSVFRTPLENQFEFFPPPSDLKIKRPRYNEYAMRARILGRVVVAFNLARNGRPRRIRVLEMPHPLLATWAIEAIAQAQIKPARTVLSNERYVATFQFTWHWAKEDKKAKNRDGRN